MPIIIVYSLPPPDPGRIEPMLQEACTGAAHAINKPPQAVWALFQQINPGQYVEGRTPAASPQQETHPPIVTIRLLTGRSPATKRAVAEAVAAAVATGLSVPPENVWIHFLEMEPTDVWSVGRFLA